ncbi:MBL fold metallo-hydrolase, partial [Halobacteriales archaeon SW_7_68_16]
MNVRFLGGAREVGRSAILIDDRLLIDFGLKTGTPPAFPIGTSTAGPGIDPEAVVVSHGHLDHVGCVPAL